MLNFIYSHLFVTKFSKKYIYKSFIIINIYIYIYLIYILIINILYMYKIIIIAVYLLQSLKYFKLNFIKNEINIDKIQISVSDDC